MADKEVFFNLYCFRCKHKDVLAFEDPCDTCLETPSRQDSHKPINFREIDNPKPTYRKIKGGRSNDA